MGKSFAKLMQKKMTVPLVLLWINHTFLFMVMVRYIKIQNLHAIFLLFFSFA